LDQPPEPHSFLFVGVTASASSIHRVFPRWAEVLDLATVRLEPLDLPLDCDRDTYRAVLHDIRDDPTNRGALVTTHKVRLLHAARDLFDGFDQYAELCDEVSCVSKRDSRVIGHAKDPITSGRALEELLAPDHFRATGAEVVCLGAGGAGLAIAVYLLSRRPHSDHPTCVTLVNRGVDRLRECAAVLDAVGAGDSVVTYIANDDPARNDDVVASAPPGSLIINATGMGKDQPGSPLTNAVTFPQGAVVWELNYRGELDFLGQARAQADDRSLTIEDGWRYFIHGWSEVIAEVFDIALTPRVLAELSDAAAEARS
jgi:shikimate 5-dehydrogenase